MSECTDFPVITFIKQFIVNGENIQRTNKNKMKNSSYVILPASSSNQIFTYFSVFIRNKYVFKQLHVE